VGRFSGLVAVAFVAAATACSNQPAPVASPSPSATASPAADAGTLAYASRTEVGLRYADGRKVRLAAVAAGGASYGLRWAPDGTSLAWVEVGNGTLRVVRYDVGTGRLLRSAGVPSADDDAPAHPEYVGTELLALAGHTMNGYTPGPNALDVRRVPVKGAAGARLSPAGAVPGALLVDSDEEASQYGGPSTIYAAPVTGVLRRLFGDADDLPDGEVLNQGVTYLTTAPDGTRIAYENGTVAGRCEDVFDVVTRAAPRWAPARPVGLPAPPARSTWLVLSLAYGEDGRLNAVLVPRKGCDPAGPARLYVQDAHGWTAGESGVTWGAASAGGTLAVLRAAAPFENGVPQPGAGRLEVLTGMTPEVVGTGVEEAAWSPGPARRSAG
jgi:hypothetical protein